MTRNLFKCRIFVMPEEGETTKKKSLPMEKLVPILVVLSIGLAFLVGTLWQKVQSLEGGTGKVTTGTDTTTGGVTTAPPQRAASGKLPEEQASKLPEVSESDHVRGSRDAKVFLVEYSDYQCPYCKTFHPTAQQAVDEYNGEVAWVLRHFPLDTLHPKARPASEASECVASLGGNDTFWKFSDAAFEGSPGSLDDLSKLATSAGVSSSSFDSCVASGKFKDAVEEDYQEGLAAGVTGTPGNFLVNQKGDVWYIPGAVPFESLKVAIDEALKS